MVAVIEKSFKSCSFSKVLINILPIPLFDFGRISITGQTLCAKRTRIYSWYILLYCNGLPKTNSKNICVNDFFASLANVYWIKFWLSQRHFIEDVVCARACVRPRDSRPRMVHYACYPCERSEAGESFKLKIRHCTQPGFCFTCAEGENGMFTRLILTWLG